MIQCYIIHSLVRNCACSILTLKKANYKYSRTVVVGTHMMVSGSVLQTPALVQMMVLGPVSESPVSESPLSHW